MIGIVIVSHSAKLAEGVVELARNMGGDDIRIKAAGGLNLSVQTLGTDPILILNAIEEVYSDDGVLVLMDLGSALLSAEMAVDMLPEEKQKKINLCEAPIVEGAIAAAVQARIGSSLAEVAFEARGALDSKREHLNTDVRAIHSLGKDASAGLADAKSECEIQVHNALGLHARPAARLVKTAGQFPQTEIRIKNLTTGQGPVNAKSINAVTTLGVLQGHTILVLASGLDEKEALEAIKALARDNFGDEDTQLCSNLSTVADSPSINNAGNTTKQGLPASGGIAVGPIKIFRPVLPTIPDHHVAQPWDEWNALQRSLDKTRMHLNNDLITARTRTDQQTADIFEAHLLYLEDEEILLPARNAIFEQKLNAAAAWQYAIERISSRYQTTGDDYLKSRAKDVEDVGRQVLIHLLGMETVMPTLTRPSILIAADLTPAETANLDATKVLGICTAFGGTTSHTAILARSMGIPAVTGLGDEILFLVDGTTLVMDGGNGEVWIQPAEEIIVEYTRRCQSAQAEKAKAQAESQAAAVTLDQHVVEIVANIGSINGAHAAVKAGAEGVGLFRSEFLFLQRETAPTEEEQYQAYRSTAKALQGRPLIIRTLDAGGDKFLPYLNLDTEANPFLGWRAIRLCLAKPEIFKPQLRAILRVAATYPVKIMFPMIATLAEFRAAKQILEECRTALQAEGIEVPDRIETGIMVEIPATAIKAEQFASEVDFFSIGTNDLTQYTMAAERGNFRLAALSDPFYPAVLELIQRVVEVAHANGKWVGVCGEMAGDPSAIPLLVGLGIDELSMSAASIPEAKQIIRKLEYQKVREKALEMLIEESPDAIREKMAGFSI